MKKLALLFAILGCESAAPMTALPDASSDVAAVTACDVDEGLQAQEDTCSAQPGDYRPREPQIDDGWPACPADQNVYTPYDPNVSSLARVAAFEQIRQKLGIGTARAPTAQDFFDARVLYAQDQGIESRVSRREDEHYPPAPKLCRDMTPQELAMYPDRCVGPVKIRPILNDAFARGSMGEDPLGNAARVEAALLWFFYVSTHKEATTCREKVADCDSMWAKYTGGEPRASAKGLSAYVRARSLRAHDRVHDGLLAVRCWRDNDNPAGMAADLTTRDKARAQLDRALLRGMALIVRQRAQRAASCAPAWESARILGGVLLREARARDPQKAQILEAETAKLDPKTVDVSALTAALDALFPCP